MKVKISSQKIIVVQNRLRVFFTYLIPLFRLKEVVDHTLELIECNLDFWSMVDKSGDCWIWKGTRTHSGYGLVRIDRKIAFAAHRVAYELTKGPVPLGLVVCHSCDNRLCVNPDHLSVGTHLSNMQDAQRKGRLFHGCARKLNWEKVAEIRKLYRTGLFSQKSLAESFGVSQDVVSEIVTGRIWKEPRKTEKSLFFPWTRRLY